MEKIKNNILIIIMILLLGMLIYPNTVTATDYDYVIDSYNVDIKVNENNTFDITESIGVYFNVPKHGIFRTIPLKNNITRLDGTINENRAKISNLKVNDNYTTSRENNNYKIKIGSANTTLTGNKNYEISYNYNIGKDRSDNYDELYFNIIGAEWDTVIRNVTFTITMPKEFDKSKLGFSSGANGSTDSSNITYNVEGNIITGYHYGDLNPEEALTVRMELPEGYFVNAGYETDLLTYVYYLVPISCLLIAIFLWFKYGKDEQVIETVEFYPPEGFNSLEIGFLYKGRAEDEDVTSLLVYLANKGYIKICEKEQKSLFSSSSSFEIIKLKEYDGNNENEELFLTGLFKNKKAIDFSKIKEIMTQAKETGEKPNSLEDALELVTDNTPKQSVTEVDLINSFYTTMRKILNNVNTKTNKKKIFESATSSKSLSIILMIAVSLVIILSIPTYEYAGIGEIIQTLGIASFYVPFFLVGFSKKMKGFFKIFWLGFTTLHSFVFFSSMPIMSAITEEALYLFGFLLGIASIIGMIICLNAMPKRTKYGNEILGKIKGFKTFLETAEKERLESLVMQDPSYFYNILPFTYVLGVSDKWISKFESISLQEPDWYYSSTGFNVSIFGSFMNNTMSSAGRAMSSSPSRSSGGSGGFSGGGSSGGGSGGGGGGSW